MDCFWRRGYEATSVRDLTDAMNITSASLYNAFGDKPALFRSVLDRYLDRVVRARIGRLESAFPPKDAIRRLFAEVAERSLTDTDRRGCLLVNSALEVAPHDRELGAHIGACLAEIESFFRRAIEAAQAEGTISVQCRARDTARLLLSALLGVRVLARSRPERSLLEGIVRAALVALDPPFPPTTANARAQVRPQHRRSR